MYYINNKRNIGNVNFSKNEVEFINNFPSIEEVVNYCDSQIALFSALKNKVHKQTVNFADSVFGPIGGSIGGALAGGLAGAGAGVLARKADPILDSPYSPVVGAIGGAALGGLGGYFMGKSNERIAKVFKKYPGLQKKLQEGRLDEATAEEKNAFMAALG